MPNLTLRCLVMLYYFRNLGQPTLMWRHNEHNGVSNHRRLDCLLNLCSAADQRKHQSSASLAFVEGIHRWPVNSPHKGPVTQKMFPFDDVIMKCWVAGYLAVTSHYLNQSFYDKECSPASVFEGIGSVTHMWINKSWLVKYMSSVVA